MTAIRPSIADKRRSFRQLHQSGCFVIPNPWDIGSARYLQGLGFAALATTSSGHAWSLGRPDGAASREAVLAHLHEMVEASDLPLNADFENGHALDAAGLADSVRLAVETGVAGLSIEDSTGDAASPLFELDTAALRMRAARRAIDQAGADVLLVGRAECFLVGRPDLDETIARLRAYAHAGADCLYAPGIASAEQIAAVVAAVAPQPVNLLIGSASRLTLAEVAQLGVRRVSVGGALARAGWGGFMNAARSIAETGRFDAFANAASGAELNAFFREDLARRAGPDAAQQGPSPAAEVGFEALVGQMAEALIFADREGRIRVWNGAAEALFGHSAAQALGQNLDLIIPERFRAAHWRAYDAAIATGRVAHPGEVRTTRAVHRDGSKVYVEMSFGVVTDAQGSALGSLAVARPQRSPVDAPAAGAAPQT
ncbi:MAG: isocitrate lyase/phosphoenolpyruvate mutase family protein [Burkholderiales bacterium]|nr:isocitrate lyase/phosphoenolpyruvate mutase family protein [Burkholderiales bacterium]